MANETVVLVHGLWMNGVDMTLLRKRLQKAGFLTHQFSYPSVARSPRENARALNTFLTDIDAEVVHFVCHSLGGIIVRRLLHEYPEQRPGRFVTLVSAPAE